MTVHPLHNLALNDLNHKLVACKIHKPSNNITVWVAFQRFHLTIILLSCLSELHLQSQNTDARRCVNNCIFRTVSYAEERYAQLTRGRNGQRPEWMYTVFTKELRRTKPTLFFDHIVIYR